MVFFLIIQRPAVTGIDCNPKKKKKVLIFKKDAGLSWLIFRIIGWVHHQIGVPVIGGVDI